MGMTDVDDKIIKRSKERGVHPLDLARGFEEEFWADMSALNIQPPSVVTRVTEHIPDVLEYVDKIMQNGFGYVSPRGDGVYFDTRAFSARHAYGKLGSSGADHLDATTNVPTESGKRDVRDFALWKCETAGSDQWNWPSRWGPGRPGWHIECSTMIQSVFGNHVDVHGGGIDLKFPHHNNEVAQAEAHGDCDHWANVFIHTGHLFIDGLKMSKSLKNFITIRELFQSVGPNTADLFRIFCLQYKYNSSISYSDDRMTEAAGLLTRLQAVNNITMLLPRHKAASRRWNDAERGLYAELLATSQRIRAALCDDFDTPSCISALLQLSTKAVQYNASVAQPNVHLLQNCASLISSTLSKFGVQLVQSSASTTSGTQLQATQSALVQFRADVRQTAVSSLKSDGGVCAKQILSLCDDLRKDTFPGLGITAADSRTSTSK